MSIEFELPEPIGKVIILDIFEYIDGPKVFSCRNKKGQIFIVNWIDTSPSQDTWFYALISTKNLRLLKQGKLSLRNVVLKSEDQKLFEVITPARGYGDVIVGLRDIKSIPEDDLPDIDSYLQTSDPIIEKANKEVAIKEVAVSFSKSNKQIFNDYEELLHRNNRELPTKGNIKVASRMEQRDVVDLSFNVKGNHEQEIDIYSLGKALVYTQELVNFLPVGKKELENRKLSRKNIQMRRLKAVGFYAASFGIRLESEVETDLFEDTSLSNTLQEFMTLIASTKDTKNLKESIEKHNLKTAKTYYDFLNLLYDNELELVAEWASPSSKYRHSKLDRKILSKAIEFLSSETQKEKRTVTIIGNLVGVNTKNHKFNIITDEDMHIYGKITRDLWRETFTIPLRVKATILEETEINLLTGKEKAQNTLQHIEQLESV